MDEPKTNPAESQSAGTSAPAPRGPRNYGENRPRPGQGGRRPGGRFGGPRPPRACPFCTQKVKVIDYKQADQLRRYLTDHGKIKARRKVGTCARHQRLLAAAIKRARHVALLPFTTEASRGD